MARQKLVQKRLRFRYREQTPDGMLLKYLSDHPTKETEELLWEAVRMCFMPMAYVHAGVTDEKVLKKVALSSFSDLARCWDCIQRELNLELPLPTSLMVIDCAEHLGAAESALVVKDEDTKADNDEVAVIEESNPDDDFWDEDLDIQMELSDQQKAARVEMDALFG